MLALTGFLILFAKIFNRFAFCGKFLNTQSLEIQKRASQCSEKNSKNTSEKIKNGTSRLEIPSMLTLGNPEKFFSNSGLLHTTFVVGITDYIHQGEYFRDSSHPQFVSVRLQFAEQIIPKTQFENFEGNHTQFAKWF